MEALMGILNTNSLTLTLDAINDIIFYGHSITNSERKEVAKWIAGRQGKSDSYANMFAPTERDFKEGIRLFTGERVHSRAAIGHILGEEACRAIILLDLKEEGVQDALKKATLGMMSRIDLSKRTPGMYCCGTCSASLWRHLAVGGLKDPKRRLEKGMKALKLHRDGKCRWRSFPFYYTLLALSEINSPSATSELRYTLPALKRVLKRIPKDNKISIRRKALVDRIFEIIG